MNNLLLLIWVHFIADFIFQTSKQALNKSTSNYWLGQHILVYTICLTPFGWKFALVNGLLHFLVDWISSRLSSYFYKQNKRHIFFIVIGADQALHMTCLVLTMGLI